MKRRLSVCLFILVVLFALFAAAETDLKDFHCGEQGYTTRIPAKASTTFQPGNGLRIWLDEPGYVPNVLIWRRTDDVEDPQTYIRETYTEHMKKTYGSRLVGTSLSEYVDMGGKRLLGATYIYKGSSGATINHMHLLEVREDGQVEYDARYLNSERDMTLAALDAAVRYYQPDSGSTGETASEEVRCEEQGYTTRMPAGKTTTFQEGNGLRIWLDEPGYVPNVLIWRRTSRLSDPDTYLGTSYPAYMKEKYGDNLVSVTQQADVDVGGKHLRGTAYVYKGSSGATINQLHLVDIREDGDVEYHARFVDSERQMTLEALDLAVRYYQPDTGASGKRAGTTASSGKKFNAASAAPIVSGTVPVKDSRFTMELPAKWNCQVSGEFMTFCYRAWDPESPNRSVFMFLKLEPFLKSQAAKNMYRQLSGSFGGSYSLFADAPVLKSLTLAGVLDAIPDTISFARKYRDAGAINPAIFPDIRNVTILEKTPSTLPAPASCTENSIARISYQDADGHSCEGLVTAQPVDTMHYDLYGVDGWPCTVYLLMGVTAPMGELAELEPVLTRCLSSFSFTPEYVKKAVNLSTEEMQTLLGIGRQMDNARSAMNIAWERRQATYDILSQKNSDAILGYDRLYDSETGEIYRAESGFYDSYDLHRNEYSNPNLQLIDDQSKQYYLNGIDYYITR